MSAQSLVGKSPIPFPFLLAAKAAFIACWFFPVLSLFPIITVPESAPVVRGTGIAFMAAGAVVASAAILNLGRSLAVGLPDTPAGLRTGGLYRFSRNPIYLGGFLVCAGSVMIVPHVLNVVACGAALILHAWIVRREEAYLAMAYGAAWRQYAARVPRWLGVPGTPPSDPDT